MTVVDLRSALASPFWQRVARGEVDLSQYTDEEILSARITLEDGRLVPMPNSLPQVFLEEQRQRALSISAKKIRDGSVAALDVYQHVLEDVTAAPRDRLAAAKFFTDRFLGPAEQHIHITGEGEDPRDILIQRLLAAKAAPQDDEDEIVDAEIVDEELDSLL